MLCPNCQRENQPTNRFCIYCGSPLPASKAENSQEHPGTLEEEVRRLRELVNRMNDRLAALEREQGMAVPPPPPVPAPAAPGKEEAPTPMEKAPPPRKLKPARVKEIEWEQIFGGSWLARIGVVALVIGIGFFLKFAFDNNWIGPTGRVALGILAGLAMLGGGYRWRIKYPVLAQVLSGGGIAVLYLSIFAAFANYNLIHFYVAFAFLLLVSVAAAALAVFYDSVSLAIIGIFGAFTAPFILGAFETGAAATREASQGVQLLAYIIVVDIGVLVLSTFRNWRWFTLLALLCTLVVFGVWHDEFGGRVSLLIIEICLTLIFLTFVGATTMFHILWRRTPEAFDCALMVINAAAYAGISLGLLWDDFRVWMGGFMLLLAIFYGGFAYIVLQRGVSNVRLSFFALGIALVFLTVAIPVQLGDSAWTTVAWAAEGAVLVWLSFILRMPQLRYYSYAIFFIVVVRLLFFDTSVSMRDFKPVLNERFLAFAVSIAAMYLVGHRFFRVRKSFRHAKIAAAVFLIAANIFSIWVLSFEVWDYFGSQLFAGGKDLTMSEREALRSAQNLSLTAVWAFYAVIALVVGIRKRWRPLRLGALALLLIAIGKVFVYDVFTLEMAYRIVAFVGLGLLLLTSAYLYHRYSKIIRGFLVEK